MNRVLDSFVSVYHRLFSPSSGEKRKREADQNSSIRRPHASEQTQTLAHSSIHSPALMETLDKRIKLEEADRAPAQAFHTSLAATFQALKEQSGISSDRQVATFMPQDPPALVEHPPPPSSIVAGRPSFSSLPAITPLDHTSSNHNSRSFAVAAKKTPGSRNFTPYGIKVSSEAHPLAPVSRMRNEPSLPSSSARLPPPYQRRQQEARNHEYLRSIQKERALEDARGRHLPFNEFRQLLEEIQGDFLGRPSSSSIPPSIMVGGVPVGGAEEDLERARRAREKLRQLEKDLAALNSVEIAVRISNGLSIGDLSSSSFDYEKSKQFQEDSLKSAKRIESEIMSHQEAIKANEERLRLDRLSHAERQSSITNVFAMAKDRLHQRDVDAARRREEERLKVEEEERRRVEARGKAAREVAAEAERQAAAAARPPPVKPVVPKPKPKPKAPVDEIVLLDSDEVRSERGQYGERVLFQIKTHQTA